MFASARTYWPLLIVIAAYVVAVICLVFACQMQNQGLLVYAVDDVYIHTALARNVAQHGTWGISPDGFTSCSSSLLWTLLLSFIFWVFGIHEKTPLLLNGLFAIATLVLMFALLRKHRVKPIWILVILFLVTFGTSLVSLTFCGLEHNAHILLTLIAVVLAGRVLSGTKNPASEAFYLAVIAPLLVMARYESLFLLFVICVLFLLRRKYVYAIVLGFCGCLPVVVFGLISHSRGWFFLPNSILLKGHTPSLSSLRSILKFAGTLADSTAWHVLGLIILAIAILALLLRKDRTFWTQPAAMLMMFIPTALLHMQFADVGWFFRYEAYLVALGIYVIVMASVSLGKFVPTASPTTYSIGRMGITVSIVVILLAPTIGRGWYALVRVPRASHDIFLQQYQMGLFLRQYYDDVAVAANDIGAPNYLSNIRCVDIYGLADMDVARARRAGTYSAQAIDRITRDRDVKIAMLYESWFEDNCGGLPAHWIKCGEWRIPDRYICASDTVSIYAVDPAAASELKSNLRRFSSNLPKAISQSGPYTE